MMKIHLLFIVAFTLLCFTAFSMNYNDTILANSFIYKGDILRKNYQLDSATYYYLRAAKIYNNLLRDKAIIKKSNHYLKYCQEKYLYAKIRTNWVYTENAQLHKKVIANLDTLTHYVNTQFDSEHILMADIHEIYGVTYAYSANYNKSTEHFLKASKIYNISLGETSVSAATCYSNLGFVNWMSGNLKMAQKYYEKSLYIHELIYSKEIDISNLYNNIGLLNIDIGEYELATNFFEKAMEIIKRSSKNEDKEIARIYGNLGLVNWQKGNYNKALDFFFKDLELSKKYRAHDKRAFAKIYNNIGIIYTESGDYFTALGFFLKSITLNIELWGEHSPNLTSNYNNIGVVYEKMGDDSTALTFFDKSIDILLSDSTNGKNLLGQCYANVAGIYKKNGDFNTSYDYYTKAEKHLLHDLGEVHIDVASNYINLADLYAQQNNYKTANDLLQKSIEILTQLFGNHHPLIADCFYKIGLNNHRSGLGYSSTFVHYQKALTALMDNYSYNKLYSIPDITLVKSASDKIRLLDILIHTGELFFEKGF